MLQQDFEKKEALLNKIANVLSILIFVSFLGEFLKEHYKILNDIPFIALIAGVMACFFVNRFLHYRNFVAFHVANGMSKKEAGKEYIRLYPSEPPAL